MKLESDDLDNLFSLVNHFTGICKDKIIRLTYEPGFDAVEIEVVDVESLETLKLIGYKILSQEDLKELEDILQMYISNEVLEKVMKIYSDKKEK